MSAHTPRCTAGAITRWCRRFSFIIAGMVFFPFVLGGRPAAECAPSYPTVCIAPYPPDLDCPDVLPLVNFAAVPPDEHNLDADNDGIACERP